MTPATTTRPRTAPRLLAIAGAIAATAALTTPAIAQTPPPGRAYEQVSPVEKNGNDVASSQTVAVSTTYASPDGSTVVYPSTGGFGDTPGVVVRNYYAARRGNAPPSWTTTPLMPPWSPSPAFPSLLSVLAVSEDGSKSFVGTDAVLTPDAVEGNSNLYVRNDLTGEVDLVATTPADPGMYTRLFDGGIHASTSLDRIAFWTSKKLTPDAIGDNESVTNGYVWSAADGLELVTRLPDGTPVTGEIGGGNVDPDLPRTAVSEDGRVFVNAEGGLYAWEDGQTTLISRSHRPGDDPDAPAIATFRAASPDGSKVLFESAQFLTPDVDEDLAGHIWLYLYDFDTDTLSLVFDQPARFWGAADDLSYIYSDVFDGDETRDVMVWHDGSSHPIVSISATEGLAFVTPSVSPDGQTLAFRTWEPLLGYDNSNPNCNGLGIVVGRCGQVMVYDAATTALECASCRPDGGRPRGSATVGGVGATVGRLQHLAGAIARAALDDGRVFFDSPEALVSSDTNGRYDVYQWLDGERSLVSTGRGESDSHFADASEDGRDLFFVTAERLVGQDTDDLADLYDARLGGGIASQNPAPPKSPCTGDGCQGSVSGAPRGGGPATDSHSGPGDASRPARASVVRIAVARRLAVRSGSVRVGVRVRGAGTVVARVRARIGARRVAVGSARAIVSPTAKQLRLSVRLSPKARRALSKRGRLAAQIAVSGADGGSRHVSVVLIGGRR